MVLASASSTASSWLDRMVVVLVLVSVLLSGVQRDTNMILKCWTKVNTFGQEGLTGEFTIYKDNKPLYTKTSKTSGYVLFSLPHTRASNSGSYSCGLKVQGQQKRSRQQKLTVKGLSKPVLHLDQSVVLEQEELTATCMAPGETGDIIFTFYDNGTEIAREGRNSNQVEVKFDLEGKGFHQIHCDYKVISFKSSQSNSVMVQVKELPFTLVLEITPQSGIYVGDTFFISCTVSNSSEDPYLNSKQPRLTLHQGIKTLATGATELNHSMVGLTSGPQEFECEFSIGYVVLETLETLLVSWRLDADAIYWIVVAIVTVAAIFIIVVIWWYYRKRWRARMSSNLSVEWNLS
ncbi:platelet endothelial cell adhesion molecule-like [Antennarius striatus]|uniref:platelet endothelial cell adhesion molecule-like n=1 Tax=Antennarius striatus TaxID=241820 RepID=UPI0035B2EF55